MLLVGDPVDWLLPMPMTLALCALLFWVWRWRWPGARRMRRFTLGLLASWFTLVSIPAVVNIGVRHMEGPLLSVAAQARAVGQADFVIVPSSGSPGVNGTQAVLDLGGYQRLMAALEVWKITGGELVFMGGMAAQAQDTLSGQMRRMAVAMGVPAERISIVPGSTTTWEDMSGAARLIAARFPQAGVRLDRVAAIGAVGDELATRPQGGEDGTRAGVPRVVLVTSAIHMKRTVLTAQYLGIEPLPLNSNYRQIASPSWRAWFPNNGTVWSIRSLLHEVIGIYAYQLSGKG